MKLKENIIVNEIAGQLVLLDILADEDDDKLIRTNETGAFLVSLLKEDISEEALIKAMTDEYDVDTATAAAHIHAFVEGLKGLDFLE